jgi:hypothetical protein
VALIRFSLPMKRLLGIDAACQAESSVGLTRKTSIPAFLNHSG